MSDRVTRRTTLAAAVLLSALIAADEGRAEEKPKNIVYLHGPWSQGLLVTQIGRKLLERIGYHIELKLLDTALVYQALATGKADLFSSAYLPGQQAYFNRQPGKLDIVSMSYGPVSGGLMVPSYVAANSIEDLRKPEVKASFGGTILGMDAGAGVMRQTEDAIKKYGLDINLVPSSVAAMTAAFQSAYEKNQNVVMVNNCPSYVCSRFKIRYLDDPKRVFGAARDMHVVRNGFRQDFPDAIKLISRLTIYSDQMSDMLVWMEGDKMSAEQAADRFLAENPDLVWYWIGDLDPKAVEPDVLKAMK